MTTTRRLGILTFLLGLTLLVGCGGGNGPQRYELSGQATYDGGKPIPHGTISFAPDDQQGNLGPSASAEIKDGRFRTNPGAGTVGGPHIVVITAYDGKPPAGDAAKMYPHGMPVGRHRTAVDIPKSTAVENFEIPAKMK